MAHGKEFWKRRSAQVLTVALLLQGALFYNASGREIVPEMQPLAHFPTETGSWRMAQEGVIEKEVQDVLRADDTLTRVYADTASKQAAASLFIAFFKTQRTGQAPHSPKNCLPGSGWTPSKTGFLQVQVPGESQPITVNRYIVSRGDDKSAVLYWYQSRGRVVASEYSAKFWLVADSMRYNRSDTALVRVVVPVIQNGEDEAIRTGLAFIESMFPLLRQYLPS